jgi:hypothetical protein
MFPQMKSRSRFLEREGEAYAEGRVEPGHVGHYTQAFFFSEAPDPKPSRSLLARVRQASWVLCLFVPGSDSAVSAKPLKRFGVPDWI